MIASYCFVIYLLSSLSEATTASLLVVEEIMEALKTCRLLSDGERTSVGADTLGGIY